MDAETDAPALYVPPDGVGRLIVASDGGGTYGSATFTSK